MSEKELSPSEELRSFRNDSPYEDDYEYINVIKYDSHFFSIEISHRQKNKEIILAYYTCAGTLIDACALFTLEKFTLDYNPFSSVIPDEIKEAFRQSVLISQLKL